jgi:hypothetical protein
MGKKIGYIMGGRWRGSWKSGPNGLQRQLIESWRNNTRKTRIFDVVITGIRAYNTVETLTNKQNMLFDFVKGGKTMLVQHSDEVKTANAPYPLKFWQVTEENAAVQFQRPIIPS